MPTKKKRNAKKRKSKPEIEQATSGSAPESAVVEQGVTWDGVFEVVDSLADTEDDGAAAEAPAEVPSSPAAAVDVEPELRSWLAAVLKEAGMELAADQLCSELFADGAVLGVLIEQLFGVPIKIKKSKKPAVQLDSLQVSRVSDGLCIV